ncbi:MAG: hypothetical protein P4L84_13160, partial [Isosphaeraceae bacterium]|nr:hypothetical protein [Isosphaeraceae bacterium]
LDFWFWQNEKSSSTPGLLRTSSLRFLSSMNRETTLLLREGQKMRTTGETEISPALEAAAR